MTARVIEEFMNRQGWSRAEMAREVQAHPSTPGRWVNRQSLPRPKERQQLVKLGVPKAKLYRAIEADEQERKQREAAESGREEEWLHDVVRDIQEKVTDIHVLLITQETPAAPPHV